MSESSSRTEQLADYQRQYRELAAQLADIGFIATGTVIQRSTRCGTPGCGCHADPPRLHGPYHQWTTKIAGKTLTRRLTHRQACSTGTGSTTTGSSANSSRKCARSALAPPN